MLRPSSNVIMTLHLRRDNPITLAQKRGVARLPMAQRQALLATGYNDVAIFQTPDGTRYGVAVMIGEPRLPVKARMAMM